MENEKLAESELEQKLVVNEPKLSGFRARRNEFAN